MTNNPISDHRAFEGKVLEALTKKVDINMGNVDLDLLSKTLLSTNVIENLRNNYSGFHADTFEAGSGTLWYDTSSTNEPILKIQRPNGEWENLTGIKSILANYFSFLVIKEVIIDSSMISGTYTTIQLDEFVKYPKSLQVFIDGKILMSSSVTLLEDKLKIRLSSTVAPENSTVRIQYLNSIPSVDSESGLDTLGDIKTTYLQPGKYLSEGDINLIAPKYLPNGSVLADGTLYDTTSYDFSNELYQILFLLVNDTKEIPSSRIISCQTLEEWEEEAQLHYRDEGEYYNEHFALDRPDFIHYDESGAPYHGKMQYRVPKLKEKELTLDYVVTKSISEEIMSIAHKILTGELDYIIELQENEETGDWYRLYFSGWLEQGGVQIGTSEFKAVQVNLLKPYTNNKYIVKAQPQWDTVNEEWFNNTDIMTSAPAVTDILGAVCNKTTNSFKIQSYSTHVWYAKGKVQYLG